MTQLENITLINSELENTTTGRNVGDADYGLHDRGQFYMQQFYASGSEAALLEGHISMFSGAAGGTGFAANYLLAD